MAHSLNHADQDKPSLSVNRQIRDVEARLYANRDTARARATVVGDQLREKLSSPVALIVAGGLGFAVAHYHVRPKERVADDDDDHQGGAPVLARVMDLISLIGSITALLPQDKDAAQEEEPESEDSTGAA